MQPQQPSMHACCAAMRIGRSLHQHVRDPLPLLCSWQHLRDLQVPEQLARACMVELSDYASNIFLPVALQALDCFQQWAVSNRLLPHAASDSGLPSLTTLVLDWPTASVSSCCRLGCFNTWLGSCLQQLSSWL